jgi:tetratricopeptide (TPR) repeat protein
MARIAAIAAALVAVAVPAQAQEPAVRQKLERAGQLAEMANSAGLAGNRIVEIASYQKALKLVDEAMAMSPNAGPDIIFGRRQIQLSLGEAWLADGKPRFALDVFRRAAADISGSNAAIPADFGARLDLARALRGTLDSAFRAGEFAEARTALSRLLAVGRAMQAADPTNNYLSRRLAQDLQHDVFFRWVLNDEAGSRQSSREALDLFRAVAEANPGSEDAMRSHFLWAYGAAELQRDDILLWREAVLVGERLESRRAMKAEHRDFLRLARDRVAKALP